MKAYILEEKDFEKLLLLIDKCNRDDLKTAYINREHIQLANDIHRSYVYHIHDWIQKVKQ